jgi:hypothetical protein
LPAVPAAFRSEVSNIKQLFDARLHAALQAVLLLTGSSPEEQDASTAAAAGAMSRSTTATPTTLAAAARTGSLAAGIARASSVAPAATATAFGSSSSSPAGSAAAGACAAAGKARSAELQQYAQQQCVVLMQRLAGQLQQQLQQLPAAPQGAAGAPVVEQVLLLARLCHALATGSTMLPALLGPPEAWPAAAKAGPDAAASSSGSSSNALPASIAQGMSALGPAAAALLRMHHPSLMGQPGGGSAAAAAAASQLAALQQQLHGIACSGYSIWATWVACSLSAALLAALKADELQHSSTAPLSWIETCVAADGHSAAASLLDPLEGDGAAAAGGDMRFALPGCPSSALLQMLSLACSVSCSVLVLPGFTCFLTCVKEIASVKDRALKWFSRSVCLPCSAGVAAMRLADVRGAEGSLKLLLCYRLYCRRRGEQASTSSAQMRCSCCSGSCTEQHWQPCSS